MEEIQHDIDCLIGFAAGLGSKHLIDLVFKLRDDFENIQNPQSNQKENQIIQFENYFKK